MKTEKVKTTAKQINRLVEDLRQQPPVSDELSDEEFIDSLTMEMMTTEEIDPIYDYPTDSPEYTAEIKRRAEITPKLESEKGKQRLENLSAEILKKLGLDTTDGDYVHGDSVAEFLRQIKDVWMNLWVPTLVEKYQFEESQKDLKEIAADPESGSKVFFNPDGDLIMSYVSTDLNLKGKRLQIRFDDWEEAREGIFESGWLKEGVVAKITVPYNERPSDLTKVTFEIKG